MPWSNYESSLNIFLIASPTGRNQFSVHWRGFRFIRRERKEFKGKTFANRCWRRADCVLDIDFSLGHHQLPDTALGHDSADVYIRRRDPDD